MDFWKHQKEAKSKTALYLAVFLILAVVVAGLAEWAMRSLSWEYQESAPFPYIGLSFLGFTLLVAGFNYLRYTQAGGRYVAESAGGILIDPHTARAEERQLLNLVEEMAIATSLPVPPVYRLPVKEINAFAAGTCPENAAVAVTSGCLEKLNRDELQAVLAHEFGHIYNRDMVIGMRVAAMITGFFVMSYLGLRLLQFSSYSSNRREDRQSQGNPVALVALIFLVGGAVTWFFGSILQAMVSRQREFLADACSVQYTRNPAGLAGALRKIGATSVSDMPKQAQPFAHLYFNQHASFWARLFATHPPLEERIAVIEGGSSSQKTDA